MYWEFEENEHLSKYECSYRDNFIPIFVCTSTYYDVRSWKITFKGHCDYKYSLLELYADTLTALWAKIVINGLFSLQKKTWKRLNLQSLVHINLHKKIRKLEEKTINKLNSFWQEFSLKLQNCVKILHWQIGLQNLNKVCFK